MSSMARTAQFVIRMIGMAIIASSFYYAVSAESQVSSGHWLHLPSFVFVFGMIVGVALTSFQWRRVMGLCKHLVLNSPSNIDAQSQQVTAAMRTMSEAFYAKGPSAVAEIVRRSPMPAVWSKVVQYLEGRIPPADIRSLLQYDAQRLEDDMNGQITVVSSLSAVAPSIGLLGTVIGLVRLLGELSDVSKLGPNMSLALLTALYGIFVSVVILNPIVTRLQSVREASLRSYEQVLFWIHLIENRKPAFYCDVEHNQHSDNNVREQNL